MLRVHARLWVGVALTLALVPAAQAQNVDATSRQNVVGSGTADRAGTEARRQQLFQRMLADPSNLDLAFEYAALSEQVGDLEAAISTLERMLVFAPGLPRLQFELGVLYYRLGSWSTAKSYFTTVMEQPLVPDDVRNQIGAYMGQIASREAGSQSFGEVGIGLRYQTNANAGPGSPFVDTIFGELILDPGALGVADTNGYVTARFRNSIDLAGQGDRFDIDVAAYGAIYREEEQLNTGVIDLSFGPNYNLAAIGIDNARLALHGDFSAAILSGDPYIASAGVGADLITTLDARTRLTLSAEARHEEFYDSDLRPTSSDRSGQRYGAGARIDYILTPDVALFTLLETTRTIAAVDYLSGWKVGASGGVIVSIGSPTGGNEDWALTGSAGIERDVADANDPVISPTDAEVKNTGYLSAGLIVPVGESFTLNSNVTYSISDSNYDLSNYDNTAVSVGVSKRF
jgi:tetratricopeptide (TPR) repeat protein